ncbi:hypothetical protein Taro_038273 [Colocasia esculenta]|uniref:Rad21/Rec8-like protein N-terminal domain-containing protein n=1 Tax=Colocasia esculenta TaxID=4460 RepID=A0A843W2Z0_COLES|nr:hypothetical protein [Colocasia esculenta]
MSLCYYDVSCGAVSNIFLIADKIVTDAQLSYRLLAHLLLGVVRIFSKKVEYLFHDCNEIIIRLGRSFISSQWNTPKETTGGRHRKVSLPKGSTHGKCENLALHEEYPSVEAVRGVQPGVTLTLPKSFELDSFDLEVPEEEGDISIHECFRLEVEEIYQPAFLNARHGDDMVAGSGLSSGCFTPVGDVIPPGILDIDFEVAESQEARISIVKWKLECDLPCLEKCGNHSSARRSLKLSIHSQETEEQAEQQDLQLAKLSEPCHTSPEGYAEVGTPVSEHGRISLLCDSEKPSVALPEAASPEFAVTTPAIKERRRISRKRKCLFDETIVLSNDTLRQWIHDASSLICKRRKAPHTFLDAWKAQKLSSIESMPSDLKAIFLESSFIPSAQEKPATPSHRSDVGKAEVLAEPEKSDAFLGTPSIDTLPSVSSAEVPSASKMDEDIPEEPLAIEKPESEMSLIDRVSKHSESKLASCDMYKLLAVESFVNAFASHYHLLHCCRNLAPQKMKATVKMGGQLEQVARYFCHCFEQEENGALSLTKVLEGKKRTKCAKCFYETLVLASRGYVDVGQELPYGDIIVSATPAMRTEFEFMPGPFGAAERTLAVTGSWSRTSL